MPVAIAALALLLGSCGAPATEAICNGDPGIRFAYRTMSSAGRVQALQRPIWENGGDYIYIDGECRYWVRQLADPPGDGTPWPNNAEQLIGPSYTGVLTPELAQRFERDLLFGAWDDLDRTSFRSGGADLPTIQLVGDGKFFVCIGRDCNDNSTAKELVSAALRWTIELRSLGVPLDGPMRGLVVRYESPTGIVPQGEPVPIDQLGFLETAVPLGESESLGYGGYPLVPEAELEMWRALRAGVIARDPWWYHITVSDPSGAIFYVNVRDVLPFEGDDGLVPPPPGL